MMTDEEAVAHAKNEPERFGGLYDKYYQAVFGFFVKRTSNAEVAKDLTSETFFQAFKQLHRFTPRETHSFKAWLFRIALAQSANYYRARSRLFPVTLDEAPELISPEEDRPDAVAQMSEDELEHRAHVAELRTAIARLNQKQQNVISLRYFSDLSVPEIAKALSMKENTVKSHLHRALNKLQSFMRVPDAEPASASFSYAPRPAQT